MADYFFKAGTRDCQTTLALPGKALGASSIQIASPTGWPTDTKVAFSIFTIDPATKEEVANTYTEWIGTLTGSSIDGIELKYGNDQPYSPGENTIVIIHISTTLWNRLITGLLQALNQDGTLKAGVVTNSAVASGANVILNPTGAMMQFAGSTAPSGWLICDGAAVSRTTYAALFTVIGTAYGTGDGSTTFNLPNMKGRVAVGLDSSDTDFNTLGKTGGAKAHTLTINELPAHNHDISTYTGTAGGFIPATTSNAGTLVTRQTASKGGDQAHNNLQPYLSLNFIIKA